MSEKDFDLHKENIYKCLNTLIILQELDLTLLSELRQLTFKTSYEFGTAKIDKKKYFTNFYPFKNSIYGHFDKYHRIVFNDEESM